MILIENDYLERVCKINPEAKMEDVVYDGVMFKCIRNFLQNPDEYIELIQKFPATRDHTYSPGFRQDIPPWAARFITLYIQEFVGEWKPARVSCNIYSGDMLMREHSNLPHSDPFHGVWNLWLTKKCLGGTAFWAYKDKFHVNELSEEEYSHLFDKPLSGTGYEKWRNFRGDEDWKMTCIAPMEFNTLLFYNGGFFHSPWIQENWYLDEYRYSMVGMGDFENV
jgi:hypothetical protein